MRTLLPALDGLDPAYLVGGAVRDLLLGGPLGRPRRGGRGRRGRGGGGGGAPGSAATVRAHDRFGTATVRVGDRTVDLASTRSETYERPGALPEVAAGGPRRGPRAARLHDQRHGRRPHRRRGRASSATRTAARPTSSPGPCGCSTTRASSTTRRASCGPCATRRGSASRIDRDTERLAREAADGLSAVSGARVRDELLDLLAEDEAPTAVGRLHALGIAAGAGPLAARGERPGGRRAAGQHGDRRRPGAHRSGGARLGRRDRLPAAPRSRGRRARPHRCARPSAAGRSRTSSPTPRRPSELHALLSPESPEALALALAFGGPAEPVLSFIANLRDARLDINGDDLLRRGGARVPGDRRGAGGDAAAQARRRALHPRRAASRGRGAGERGVGLIELDLAGARVAFSTRAGGRERGPVRVAEPRASSPTTTPRAWRATARSSPRAPASTRTAWRWAGRCTAPTSSAGTAPPAAGRDGFAEPGAELAKVDGHVTDLRGPRPAGAGGGLPAGRARRRRGGWRCCTAAGAGWRAASSRAGSRRFDEPPAAAVGPGIGRCCFEVGEEVLAEFADVEGAARGPRCSTCRAVAEARLRAAGVTAVEHVDLCTSCRADLFFSHRRDGGVTGRQGGLIWREA